MVYTRRTLLITVNGSRTPHPILTADLYPYTYSFFVEEARVDSFTTSLSGI